MPDACEHKEYSFAGEIERRREGGGRGEGGKSKYVHTCMYIYMYVMYNITERIYMNMHMYV